MPMYDYRCNECGEEFTMILSFHEIGRDSAANPECPKCTCRSTQRIIKSIPTIKFNGEGFYINDKDKPT